MKNNIVIKLIHEAIKQKTKQANEITEYYSLNSNAKKLKWLWNHRFRFNARPIPHWVSALYHFFDIFKDLFMSVIHFDKYDLVFEFEICLDEIKTIEDKFNINSWYYDHDMEYCGQYFIEDNVEYIA